MALYSHFQKIESDSDLLFQAKLQHPPMKVFIRYFDPFPELNFELLTQLNHPKLIKFIDRINKDSKSGIVLEFVEGTNLKQYLLDAKGTQFDESFIVSVFSQLVDTIEYLHSKMLSTPISNPKIFFCLKIIS